MVDTKLQTRLPKTVDLEVDLDGMLVLLLMVVEILQLIPIIHKFRDIEVERVRKVMLMLEAAAAQVVLVNQENLRGRVQVVLEYSV